MLGRKTITPPTPPITPLTNKSFQKGEEIFWLTELPNQVIPLSIQFMGYCPIEKVEKNISQIKNKKIGNPQ